MNFAPVKNRASRGGAIAIAAGLALVVSACSSYDRQETIDELVNEQGIDPGVATCIVDGMEEKIGEDRLGERGDPTPEEEQLIIEITTDCLIGG